MQTPNKEGRVLPMLTLKNPDGSQRVIKQIMVIDQNKLRVAGLDLKMAEALKKAKGKTTASSKDKMALAKSLLNKKLKQAQMSKESNKAAKLITLSQSISSSPIGETVRKLSITSPPPKPPMKFPSSKTRMPPPTSPATPNQSHSLLLNFLNSEKPNSGDVVNTSLDSQKESAPQQIPKASRIEKPRPTPQPVCPLNIERKVISKDVQFGLKKKPHSKQLHVETVPNLIKVNLSTSDPGTLSELPLYECRPKVIESKVLSPDEEIDLNSFRIKPSNHPPIRQCYRAKPLIATSMLKETSPKRVVEESAVDFINSLLDSSMSENEHELNQSNEAPIADATSFLISLLGQQGTESPYKSPVSSTSELLVPTPVIEEAPAETEKIFQLNQKSTVDRIPSPEVAVHESATTSKVTEPSIIAARDLTTTIEGAIAEIENHKDEQDFTNSSKDCLTNKEEVKEFHTVPDLHTLDPISSTHIPSQIDRSFEKDEPPAGMMPPIMSSASPRRKGRKSVPVLIAKLSKSRKPSIFQKPPHEIVPKVPPVAEEKSSEKSEELEKTKPEVKQAAHVSEPLPNSRRTGKKLLPVMIAKLQETRKSPSIQEEENPTEVNHIPTEKFASDLHKGYSALEVVQDEEKIECHPPNHTKESENQSDKRAASAQESEKILESDANEVVGSTSESLNEFVAIGVTTGSQPIIQNSPEENQEKSPESVSETILKREDVESNARTTSKSEEKSASLEQLTPKIRKTSELSKTPKSPMSLETRKHLVDSLDATQDQNRNETKLIAEGMFSVVKPETESAPKQTEKGIAPNVSGKKGEQSGKLPKERKDTESATKSVEVEATTERVISVEQADVAPTHGATGISPSKSTKKGELSGKVHRETKDTESATRLLEIEVTTEEVLSVVAPTHDAIGAPPGKSRKKEQSGKLTKESKDTESATRSVEIAVTAEEVLSVEQEEVAHDATEIQPNKSRKKLERSGRVPKGIKDTESATKSKEFEVTTEEVLSVEEDEVVPTLVATEIPPKKSRKKLERSGRVPKGIKDTESATKSKEVEVTTEEVLSVEQDEVAPTHDVTGTPPSKSRKKEQTGKAPKETNDTEGATSSVEIEVTTEELPVEQDEVASTHSTTGISPRKSTKTEEQSGKVPTKDTGSATKSVDVEVTTEEDHSVEQEEAAPKQAEIRIAPNKSRKKGEKSTKEPKVKKNMKNATKSIEAEVITQDQNEGESEVFGKEIVSLDKADAVSTSKFKKKSPRLKGAKGTPDFEESINKSVDPLLNTGDLKKEENKRLAEDVVSLEQTETAAMPSQSIKKSERAKMSECLNLEMHSLNISHTKTEIDCTHELRGLRTEEPPESQNPEKEEELAKSVGIKTLFGKSPKTLPTEEDTTKGTLESDKLSAASPSPQHKENVESSPDGERLLTTRKKHERSTTPKGTKKLSELVQKNEPQSTETPTSSRMTKGKSGRSTAQKSNKDMSSVTELNIITVAGKVSQIKEQFPDTPVCESQAQNKSKAKAGISTQKITKIVNVVSEELSIQNMTTNLTNEGLQTVAPRSRRVTRKSDGKPEDQTKENKKLTPSTSKTRQSSKTKESASVPDTEVANATPKRRKNTKKQIEDASIVIQKSLSESPPTETTNSAKRDQKEPKTAKTRQGEQLNDPFDILRNKDCISSSVSPSQRKLLPISSRISVDSHGFEDWDPDLNNAVLEVATAVEETLNRKKLQADNTPQGRKAKNPFKKDKAAKNEQTKKNQTNETGFLGFNEQEIEEGQQSTSLRLSQSGDASPLQLLSARVRKKKASPPIKKTPLSDGKKKKAEKTNWKKNSAVSMQSWLTTPVKSPQAVEKVPQENSIPLKKRRSRKQNLNESVKADETPIVEFQKEVGDTSKSDLNDSKPTDKSKQRKTATKNISKAKEQIIETSAKPGSGQITEVKPLNILLDDKTTVKTKSNKRKKPPAPEIEPPNKIAHLPEEVPRKKRGRPPANAKPDPIQLLQNATETPPPTNDLADLNDIKGVPRQLGRPTKLKTSVSRPAKSSYVPVAPIDPLQRKFKNDSEFNPRLLLITKKEQLKSNEPLEDPDMQTEAKYKDDVQCALCMGFTSKKKWVQHISTHYGVGWIVGTPPQLNINSRSSVLNSMVEFFRVSKVKGLNCRICKGLRRSALGLLVHLEQCCLTEDEIKDSRVVCEHCTQDYSKSSIILHLRTCSVLLRKKLANEADKQKSIDKVPENEVLSNAGRLKRKSVIKAEIKLKNLDDAEFVPDELIKHIVQQREDVIRARWLHEIQAFGKVFCAQKKCPFTAPTVEEMVQHFNVDVCPFFEIPGYVCRKCKFYADTIDICREHVVEKHKPKPMMDFDDSSDDADIGSESSSESISSGDDENAEGSANEGVDAEEKRRKKKMLKKSKATKRRRRVQKTCPTKDFKKLLPDRTPDIASQVAGWYEEFISQHYSKDPLFTFATPSANQTDGGDYESLFPKSPISMKFVLKGFNGFVGKFGHSQVTPDQWRTLEIFKGTALPHEHIAYIGAPVKFIAWAPIEPHPASATQYLAIATRKAMDKFTRCLKQKKSGSLLYIQKYHLDESNELCGEIHYALPIEKGPIHCLEFLPSGGYAPDMNRLGLLAVGTVETEIQIYSLPLEVEKRDCDIFPIIRLEPAFVLCLEVGDTPNDYTNAYQSQCISIAWSQTAGHTYIIGGYINGFVAIWDISEDDDNLNRTLVNGLRKYVPVTYFWTMDNRINQIVAHYDENGLRWLAVCNQNRKLLLYDLREITRPILFHVETTKNVCNSVDWPIVWENPSCALGDAMPSHGRCITTISPMSLVFVSRRFDKFCCGVNDMNFNTWRNLYAAGGDNGDIHVTSLKEAVLDVGSRMKNDDKIVSTLDIVPLDGGTIHKKDLNDFRLFEPDYKEKYGLVFGAAQKMLGSKHPSFYSERRTPTLNLARFIRVNRLRFNPNRSANCFLAVGYENGFIRVLHNDWYKSRRAQL